MSGDDLQGDERVALQSIPGRTHTHTHTHCFCDLMIDNLSQTHTITNAKFNPEMKHGDGDTEGAASAGTHSARADASLVPATRYQYGKPVWIAGAVARAVTWQEGDDPLLWVFLPSLDWELVKYLHLRRGGGKLF